MYGTGATFLSITNVLFTTLMLNDQIQRRGAMNVDSPLMNAQYERLSETDTANYIVNTLNANAIKNDSQIWNNNCNGDGTFCKTMHVHDAVFSYRRPFLYFDISYYYELYRPEDGREGRQGSQYMRYAVDIRYLTGINYDEQSAGSGYRHYHLNLRCNSLCVTAFYRSWDNNGALKTDSNYRDYSMGHIPPVAINAEPIVAEHLSKAIWHLKELQPPLPKDPFD
jgi:hypothetical protein